MRGEFQIKPKGTPGTLRVNVSRAPNAATTVTLASSNNAIASVPPTANVAAGALFVDVPVSSNSIGTATIRVLGFGLFDDTSNTRPFGFPISLNVIATK